MQLHIFIIYISQLTLPYSKTKIKKKETLQKIQQIFLPPFGNFFQAPFQGSKAFHLSFHLAKPSTKFFIETSSFTSGVFIFLMANWNQAPDRK